MDSTKEKNLLLPMHPFHLLTHGERHIPIRYYLPTQVELNCETHTENQY